MWLGRLCRGGRLGWYWKWGEKRREFEAGLGLKTEKSAWVAEC